MVCVWVMCVCVGQASDTAARGQSLRKRLGVGAAASAGGDDDKTGITSEEKTEPTPAVTGARSESPVDAMIADMGLPCERLPT